MGMIYSPFARPPPAGPVLDLRFDGGNGVFLADPTNVRKMCKLSFLTRRMIQ
jgi:hypothetical protein